ncbi:MAG: ATP-binding cassette domain-containing protein, partial [Chloroflexi bacterium]|nr:ATP-binding cassette domain-containing protein [Chloroflexota bacterium]
MSTVSTDKQEEMAENEQGPLLTVENLGVTFYTTKAAVRAVRDASFEIRRGEVLGVVGESGCGKSTVAFAIMGYLAGSAHVDGKIIFAGQDINELKPSELEELRGNRIAMVYQDPATALN